MSGGRGWQLQLLKSMGRSSANVSAAGTGTGSGESGAESGIQSGEQTSSGQPKDKLSKDSGEESSLSSGSLGRGKKMELLLKQHASMQQAQEAQAPASQVETAVESSRGGGRGMKLKMLQEASLMSARQYQEKPKVSDVTKMLEQTTLTENKDPVLYRGSKGVTVTALSNYLPLKWITPERIYEYCVFFEPQVDSIHLRIKIMGQLKDEIGSVYIFSGFNVYLPRKLDAVTVAHTKLLQTQETIKVTLKLIKEKPEEELIPVFNNLFNKIMRELKFVRHKRKQYDPTKAKIVQQHKIEIWPGYVTAVDTFEGGLMLNLDVSHRRLSTMTILQQMGDIHRTYPAIFHKKVKETLIGKVVLTRYNNQTYRIDEVDFNLNPENKFMRGTEEISYMEYYRRNYNITIMDTKQPLLLSFKQVRVSGSDKKEERTTCLIPELCYTTGLTDEQLNNATLKRDLAPYITVAPQHRVDGLRKFLNNVRECPAARKVLEDWGLELAGDCINLEARELGVQKVQFNDYTGTAGVQADFSRDATQKRVLSTIPLNQWAVVYVERNKNEAKTFLNQVMRNSPQLGMSVKDPQHVILRNDTNQEFITQITQVITSTPDLKLVVCIFPTQRGDLYGAVKKICCYTNPVPSQVIMARTLSQSNESKVRSIVMKILLQMNCKVGGTLWSIAIPMAGTMICGVDAFHDPSQKSPSVTGFVASINRSFTRWYSMAIIQNIREEVSRSLGLSIKEALIAYRQANGSLPERIVIFRDGVGDGQLQLCENFEVPQIIEAAQTMYPKDAEPKLTYVVTQKRINTRFFRQSGGKIDNPAPGTVVDHSVTRRYMTDFFLISQNVRQGTVTPSHYIVVYDSAKLTPDVVQQLAYKLTFMYYNWPGTIRVPACCQYAHKLAYLIGEHVKKEPAKQLQDKLFYL